MIKLPHSARSLPAADAGISVVVKKHAEQDTPLSLKAIHLPHEQFKIKFFLNAGKNMNIRYRENTFLSTFFMPSEPLLRHVIFDVLPHVFKMDRPCSNVV